MVVVTVEATNDADSWRIDRVIVFEIVRICEDQIKEWSIVVCGNIEVTGGYGVSDTGITPEFEKTEDVHGRESQSWWIFETGFGVNGGIERVGRV